MESSNKRIKTEEDDSGSSGAKNVKDEGGGGGGGGGGSSGGAGGNNISLRTGGCAPPDSDLVLVGRILDGPNPPIFEVASGGRMINAHVETWMSDLYRSSQWYIELPNVEDVADVNRRKIKVKAIPLGAPTTPSPVGVANGSQGRLRLEGMRLALFSSGHGSGGEEQGDEDQDGWEMISGTPNAYFTNIWNNSTATPGDGRDRRGENRDKLADEFKKAKVYITQAQVLEEQRDWLLV